MIQINSIYRSKINFQSYKIVCTSGIVTVYDAKIESGEYKLYPMVFDLNANDHQEEQILAHEMKSRGKWVLLSKKKVLQRIEEGNLIEVPTMNNQTIKKIKI